MAYLAMLPISSTASATCQKWCEDSANSIPAAAPDAFGEHLCIRNVEVQGFGQIVVTNSADDGLSFNLDNLRDEVSRDDLVKLAVAMMSLAHDARTDVAA